MAARLVFPFIFALLFASCSDGTQCQGSLCDEENAPANGGSGGSGGEERPPPREGPEGCYISAARMCDCDIEEADCTEEGQTWTEGCASCAE